MSRSCDLKAFPPNTDPTNPGNAGGVPLYGSFDVARGSRVLFQPEPGQPLVPELDRNSVPLAGAWFGKAVPNATIPGIEEVVMMLNFYPDGNMGPSDALENAPGFVHGTAHGGPWRVRDDGIVEGMSIWQNLGATTDIGGYAKVRITAQFDDPTTHNKIIGTVRPRPVPPTGDPLDPTDSEAFLLGHFNIVELTRIGDDSQSLTTILPSQDYGVHPIAGTSYFGRATAVDPANSRFAELFITPTFGKDGNIWMNDSQQDAQPHGTTFGNWIPAGDNKFEGTAMWQNLDTSAGNNFGGATKVIISGEVNPDTNMVLGQLELVYFPTNEIPLPHDGDDPRFHADPDNVGGVSWGTYTFTLSEIETVPEPTTAALALIGLALVTRFLAVARRQPAQERPHPGRFPTCLP